MEARIKSYSQFLSDRNVSESLVYHVNAGHSITESIYRPGSKAHLELLSEARDLYFSGDMVLTGIDLILMEMTDLGLTGFYKGQEVPLDLPLEVLDLNEQKKPKLNYPMRGGTKKYQVYVRNPKTGRIMKIAFGDVRGGLTAKVSNPKARKSFAARHNCAEKKDRTKAGYWACRINRYAHLWGGKTYPGFW
jgi:hypothetical protein